MSNFAKFNEYYQQFMPQVYGYVYLRVNRDKALTEDLVSEIFMKALEKFDTFSEKEGSFRAWVFKITKNHLIDYYRSSKSKEVESLDEIENLVADEFDTAKAGRQEWEKEELYKALEELSEDKREIVTLKYLSGYSYKEIAEILKEDENKIRVKSFRAVKDLQRKLYALKYQSNEPGDQ